MKKMVCMVFLLALGSFAGDWPQFCGPGRDNVSVETGLADSWPENGPEVLWETEVHDGYSGPAIKDGNVYLIDREGGNSLLRCLDLDSGQEIWRVSFADAAEMKGKKFSGTRGTPTITDDSAYLVTGYGTFACIDLKTKKVKWTHSLLKDYDNELHQFGIAQSPSVHGSRVFVAPNSTAVGVAAYDRESGERLWTSPGLGYQAYISPRIVNICGQDMVVAVGSSEKVQKSKRRKGKEGSDPEPKKEFAPAHVVGLFPGDGSILWDYTGWRCHMAIPHPVELSGGRLFITGGYDAGSAMIQIVRKGSGFEVEELYRTGEVGSQLHPPIRVGNHLFISSNSNSRKDGLASFSLDGKLEWRTKDIEAAPNFERGSFILADGKLIILDGKSGILYLVKADPEKYTELASAPMVGKNDMAWAPLALSNGKLLVRDWNTLKCVDLR
ncbi:MAG: PQQ-binding-like beta-propeller repeat protein [Verrucomicrobiota bacterium]|nr:PQQ-binding-like beta-propeller repeat protein [Verrucomicrobiota bacterium]